MTQFHLEEIGELGRRAPRAKRAARAGGNRRAAPSGGAANRQQRPTRAQRRAARQGGAASSAQQTPNSNNTRQRRPTRAQRRAAQQGGAASSAQQNQPKPSRAERRAANKAKRNERQQTRQHSQRARQNARQAARMMKQRRRLFDRLFRGRGLRGLGYLGNTPAAPPARNEQGSEFVQAQPNSAQQAAVQFENHMLAQLNEAEIESVGKYVSAVVAQNVTEANIEAFTRAEMGKDPTLATALMKLRSGWQRTGSGNGGRADTSPVMPNARTEDEEDFDAGTETDNGAPRSANRTGENQNRNNLLIGGAIVAGAALLFLMNKKEKPATRTRTVVIRRK